ncbi:hypothetical protein [Streptomyces sp. BH105]|uniref:hypothetical protein n=1 Tax=Streptomyces sp. BH105 TaxID=3410408 RepID=UPI003CEF60E5
MSGRDWSQMGRGDFDAAAPLALVDVRDARAATPVPAVPDRFGTEALFGDEAPVPRPRGRRRIEQAEPQGDALF